jgi:hypothetical protein
VTPDETRAYLSAQDIADAAAELRAR